MISPDRAFNGEHGLLTCPHCSALASYELVVNVATGRDVALLRLPFERPGCPSEDEQTCAFLANHVAHLKEWP